MQAIAILRLCKRCAEWRSIDAFNGVGKVCQRCIAGGAANHRIAIPRAIVLTSEGRGEIKNSA